MIPRGAQTWFRPILTASIALALAAAWSPAAHLNTISYPAFTIFEREARLDLRVKVAYFTDMVSFTAPGDAGGTGPPVLTEASVRAKEPELVKIASGATRFEADGTALEARFDGFELTTSPSGVEGEPPILDNAVFHFRFVAEAPIVRVRLQYRLFAAHDPGHRGIAKIRAGTSERSVVLYANTVYESTVDDLTRGGALEAAGSFFLLGMEHIFTGYDHLLFVVALLLTASSLRSVFLVVTGFTLAHSATLILAALKVLTMPVNLVEPAIAASIVWVGAENLWRQGDPRRRWLVASAFGLVHGLGFAGFIHEVELPAGATAIALGAFNVGVEAGQATVVCLAFPILEVLRQRLGADRYRATVVKYGSLAVAAVGLALLAVRVAGSVAG